eukprot:757441-Hanusia_phi.AAC.2
MELLGSRTLPTVEVSVGGVHGAEELWRMAAVESSSVEVGKVGNPVHRQEINSSRSFGHGTLDECPEAPPCLVLEGRLDLRLPPPHVGSPLHDLE